MAYPHNPEIVQNADLIDLQKIARLISRSGDLRYSCLLVKNYFSRNNMELRTVAFCDLENEYPTIMAFRNDPQELTGIATELHETIGCPEINKAVECHYPFDALKLSKNEQPDFLTKRYLNELAKFGHQSIAIIPIRIGRGLAVFSVGLFDSPFAGELRSSLISTTCQITIAIISRFPNITKLFETRCLNPLEAKVMLLCSNGFNNSEIGNIINLSERTINMVFDNVAAKIGAKNQAHAVSKAVAMGEISNLQLDPNDTKSRLV